eukprot:CAMPEP_0174331306 /NCGR_PEP_ID=MMETSP0810-20121108/17387_1 /TAXON_ID=73025 ORGANISM="Eutreptiella gymnastica-like, Strain CCMP1594" /NCGR_SAMPLE_ID=MMETSP0810 /ASSEMBLY_ACC=CAM_ASM_000659 /LENGTH=208 /DNA_ID=CAMNT_0015447025 /DNA_START=29 /DNA_END=651 /DNA_ORIENTATION=+
MKTVKSMPDSTTLCQMEQGMLAPYPKPRFAETVQSDFESDDGDPEDKSTTDSPHSSGFHAFDLSPDTASQRVPKHSPKRGPFFTRASLSKRGSVPGTPGRWNPITAISWGRAKAREEDFSATVPGCQPPRAAQSRPPLQLRFNRWRLDSRAQHAPPDGTSDTKGGPLASRSRSLVSLGAPPAPPAPVYRYERSRLQASDAAVQGLLAG